MISKQILEEPYQAYGDSPTIKSYTLWKLYDKYIVKLVKNEIKVGGSSGAKAREYDLVIDGDKVLGNNQSISIKQSSPYGIIHPEKDKLTKIHYYLIRGKAYRILLENGEYNILSTIPEEEAIIPQHLVIDVKGKTLLKIVVDGKTSKAYRSLFIEINMYPSSHLDLIVILEENKLRAPSNIEIGVRLEKYSRLNLLNLLKPGIMTRYYSTIILDGEYSEAYTRGIALLKNNNRIDHSMNLVNRSRNTYSNYLFTGIAMDKSIIAQRGLGKITSNAYGSGVEYYSEALIRDEDARAYLQPRLEIDTGNVTIAKHAARNIHILPEQVFYLQTRGISRADAEKLIIIGYLTKQIPISKYKEQITSMILDYLNNE